MTSANAIPLQQHPVYVLLRQIFQQTKTHLSITNLNFSHPLIEKSPHIFPIFLQRNLKKLRFIPPKLKRLTLDLHFAKSSPLPLYTHLLKNLKHIEHLKITLCQNDSHQAPSYFQILLKILRKARNLQVVEVIASRHFQWTEENSMSSLLEALSKSAPRLKDVKLIFEGGFSGSLDEPKYKTLLYEWKIQKLATLQNLTLHLPRAAFITMNTEDEGKFDLSPLRSFRKLKSLDLGFLESSISMGPYFKKFIVEPSKIRLFPNLKRFQWNLIDSHCTEIEGLQLLGSELATIFRVPPENFTLKFKQNAALNEYGLAIVKQSFASLTTDLSHLHLIWKELDSKGSQSLISVLSAHKVRKLQVLYLDCVNSQGINDRFMAKFGQVISRELKYLRLRFELMRENEKGFAGVLKNIFGEEGITDKGISKFGEDLAEKCNSLKFVWLEFGKCEKISDKGVKSLCESLSKIESLKRVWLKFRLCWEVSAIGEQYAKEKLGPNRKVQFDLI